MNEKYFKMVEAVLDTFDEEFRKNYYINKGSLIIEKEEQKSNILFSSYDYETNTITNNIESSLPHSLFCMAFSDRNKVGKKIHDDLEVYYGAGVSFIKYKNGEKFICNKGATVGFCEYLSRKFTVDVTRGSYFDYYFIDLLISIYGEEILKYPLENDPIGLFCDERFFDIAEYLNALDILNECKSVIQMFRILRDEMDIALQQKDIKIMEKILKIIERTKKDYKESIINLFKLIVSEYINCSEPMTDKDGFILKLEEFLVNEDYNAAFGFDDEGFSVKEEVSKTISTFKEMKVLKKYSSIYS